jgi:hypothetical protein
LFLEVKTDHIVKAAKELGESFTESACLLSGFNGAMHEVNGLYDHGYGGAGKSLISLGVAIVVFPEPFMISDLFGAGLIGAGMVYNHFVPPPMFIDNVFQTIEEQVKALGSTGEGLSQFYTPNVDFSSFRFEI